MTAGTSGPVVVVINPISGPKRRGSPSERVRLAKRAFDQIGASGEIRLTERPHHAYDLAQEAVRGGARLVIAWGGDGTINEVGRALVHTTTSLGIIPGGSGNGLSRALKIPFDPSAAFQRVLGGSERMMDVGELDGRLFFNIAGIGLDAHVAGSVAGQTNHRGLIPYLTAGARDLLKFTPAGKSVDLSLSRSDETMRISVTDEGEGIEPSFLPHVFERLRQADNSAKRAGLGLGLAIARHIIDLHQGHITAESEGLGKGARFTISIPVAEPGLLHARETVSTQQSH